MIILWIFMVVNLFFLVSTIGALKQLEFARKVLHDIDKLHSAGVITTIQANVFLNDMTNPMDVRSIMEVRRELNYIVEKELNAIEKSTN